MCPSGFVSYGENPEDTVIREVKEETGLNAKVVRLLGVEQVDDDPRSMGHFSFFYLIKVNGGNETVDKNENSEVGWFDLKSLPKIGWHDQKKTLKKLASILH
jgi:ADP-ribose pyrophosphatase YjhB (NUDIX family)